MKILIAEDDAVSRKLLQHTLTTWNYEVLPATSGVQALALLTTENPPSLAIIDWMMPEMDGIELIRNIRETEAQSLAGNSAYLILLTAAQTKEGLVNAFEAGADDYLTKPFDKDELRSRLKAATRILTLQKEAALRIAQLEASFASIKQLQALLPMCSYCRKIRQVENDQNYWSQLETYVSQHTDTQFSHGICPDCYETQVKPQLEARNLASEVCLEIHPTPLVATLTQTEVQSTP